MNNHKDFGAGAAICTFFFGMVPDGVLTWIGKGLGALIVAVVTGFAYKAGQWLWDRLSQSKENK